MFSTADHILAKFDIPFAEIPLAPGFSSIVTSISAASGASLETATVATLQVLCGLAGWESSHQTSLSTPPRPGVNLAIAPDSPAAWQACHELLLSPVTRAADAMRDRARAASAQRLREWMDYRQQHNELDHPDDPRDPMRGTTFPVAATSNSHRVAVSSQPIFYLSDPGRPELERGLSASFDHSILLDLSSTDLLDRLSASAGKTDIQTAELVIRLLQGSHVAVKEQPIARNPIGLEQATASALLSIRPDTFRSAFLHRDPTARKLLQEFIFFPAPRIDPDSLASYKHPIEEGLASWRSVVVNLFFQRRRGSVGWLEDQAVDPLDHMGEYRSDVLSLEAALPQQLQPYCCHLLHLPVRLLGALEHMNMLERPTAYGQPGKSSNLEAAQMLGRLAVGAHARFLLNQYQAIEEQRNGAITVFPGPEQKMLQKIRQKGPLLFRDLARSYSRQCKSDHQPVLQNLIQAGQVRLDDNGLLAAIDHEEEQAG